MAKSKAKVEAKPEVKAPALKFEYLCPACTGVAIKTSNKMLKVEVDCKSCKKRITLDDIKRYKKA